MQDDLFGRWREADGVEAVLADEVCRARATDEVTEPLADLDHDAAVVDEDSLGGQEANVRNRCSISMSACSGGSASVLPLDIPLERVSGRGLGSTEWAALRKTPAS